MPAGPLRGLLPAMPEDIAMNAPIVDMVLCGANLFGVCPMLDQRHRKDWLHSNLLAQLAADRKYPQHAPGWRETYEQALGYMAWTLEKTQAISAQIPASTPLSISALLMAQLPRLLTEPQRLAVAGMLDRLRQNQDSPFSRAVATRMCLADVAAAPPANIQDGMNEEPRAAKKLTRLALSLSVVLAPNQALTLQLGCDTRQALDRGWLGTILRPGHVVGDVAFRYTAWFLGDYAENRASVDERLGDRIATHLLAWSAKALPD